MTTIILPPDLEGRLIDEARRRGTSPELLALDELRRRFAPDSTTAETTTTTLFEYLSSFIGAIDGTTEPLSENCGSRFAEGMVEKQRQGRL